MGVIYKLTANIREDILKQRLSDSNLSCRKLVSLVLDKFQVKVSKSSINAIIRAAGFSMPVGPRARRRTKIYYNGLGVFFLKAMDLLAGASQCITEVMKKNIGQKVSDIGSRTEALLFNSFNLGPETKELLGWGWTDAELSAYLSEAQKIEKLDQGMFNLFGRVFQEIKCIKIEFKDGTYVFIDSQRHNVWATDKIPDIFSAAVYETNNYLTRYFNTAEPFVLLQASGYDKPSEDFFRCVSALKGDNVVSKIALLDNNLKESILCPILQKKHSLLFGLWPWQFADYRAIKNMGEFIPLHSSGVMMGLFIAEVEIELLSAARDKSVALRGSAVKSAADGPIRLFILSNDNELNFEELTRIYFSHWPNLEETFKDYSNKIEVYSKTPGGSFVLAEPSQSVVAELARLVVAPIVSEPNNQIEKIFHQYLLGLNLYFSRYFLPHTYQNNDFPTLKKDFYDLKGSIKKHKDYLLITFKPPQDYPYLNELRYACNRLNERFILLRKRFHLEQK